MAAEFIGAAWTVLGTATSLTTILGERVFWSELHIRMADASGASVFVGPSTVTAAGLFAFEEATFGATPTAIVWRPSNGCKVSSDHVFLIGTAGAANIAYISVIA